MTIRWVEDVARGLRCHPETLRKTFARAGNGSLWQCVQRCRVEKMKELLVNMDLKCLAICQEVGIDREDTGSKLFKGMVGMTMKEYRDNVKKQLKG